MENNDSIVVYTDGACTGNPGPGGWAAIIQFNGRVVELSGPEHSTTNNRMELLAAIRALEAITVPSKIRLVSDSKYLLNGIKKWLHDWKSRGWKTSSKKNVKNIDLWKELDRLNTKHTIIWDWTPGHSGHTMNERCDRLARRAITSIKTNSKK